MNGELVFSVTGSDATVAQTISLAEAGLQERKHLQEWVLANPEILGEGVLIVTSEFDRWESRSGAERDRLDILGLRKDGHLVIAELKRDTAPDTVEMQAIKYAAMASRFDLELLADAYADFQSRFRSNTLTAEEAADALQAHTSFTLTEETLRAPRIVLLAGRFPSNVTATSVWLSEMGLDITLIRVQAYRIPEGIVITVSQHYPPPDTEDFLVAPTRAARLTKSAADAPVVDWTLDDLGRLMSQVPNVTVQATMDLCASRPVEWIGSDEVQAVTQREPAKHRGDYGGFGITLKRRFGRSNAPYETKWAAGGSYQAYYRLSEDLASAWNALRISDRGRDESLPEGLDQADPFEPQP